MALHAKPSCKSGVFSSLHVVCVICPNTAFKPENRVRRRAPLQTLGLFNGNKKGVVPARRESQVSPRCFGNVTVAVPNPEIFLPAAFGGCHGAAGPVHVLDGGREGGLRIVCTICWLASQC